MRTCSTVEVRGDELGLVGERGRLAARRASDARRKRMKLSSMRFALGRVRVDEARHVGERVEEEMRLDLRLERAQVRGQ
jgi:hypothetical protein